MDDGMGVGEVERRHVLICAKDDGPLDEVTVHFGIRSKGSNARR